MRSVLLLAALAALAQNVGAFRVPVSHRRHAGWRRPSRRAAAATTMMATPATLDGSTLWRLYFSLVYTSEDGTKNLGAQETVVTGRFVEDEGYEPPQGYFVVDEV